MAEVPVTINGVIVDYYGRTIMGPVKIVGSASLTGVGVGGGPIIPPEGGEKPPGLPPGIWPGPGDPDFPGDGKPPGRPPGIWGGGNEPFPTPPIYFPPMVPPSVKPPEPPQPGDPTTAVPGSWPVHPVTPPAYAVFNYPGIGPVVVAPPVQGEAAPQK